MSETRKLYRVQLQGMTSSLTGTQYGISYVVASDPAEAYEIVRAYLDKRSLGFSDQREMDSITLIAEESDYPDCKHQLFVKEAK
jgi:hypothetical protein